MNKSVFLSDNYNRSTNLELDYQDSKKLKNIYMSPKFVMALEEVLDSILNTNSAQRVQVLSGSPGLGKSTFALLLSQLIAKNHPKILKNLLIDAPSRLNNKFTQFQKNKKTKLLPIFFNGYGGDIEKVFISKLSATMKDIGIDNKIKKNISALQFYKDAVPLINKKGFSGIFVIYDEFGKYLEKGVHNPSELNIQFLQDFAEFCDRSGASQCHLILITHLSVSQYASQLPINVQREWAKIEGRFKESAFYDKGTDYYNMISSVFVKNINQTQSAIAKRYKQDINKYINNFKSDGFSSFIDTKDIKNILLNCFPLHPAALAFLPHLSTRVAQNERTLYTFLTRDEDYSLKSFLKNKKLSEKSLLMPYDLYQYFSRLIGKDIGIGGAYKVHLMAEEAFSKINKTDNLAKQIIAIMAMASVIKDHHFAPLNKTFIASCLGPEFKTSEVEKTLLNLESKKIIFYNKNLKQYLLQEGSCIDVAEEIGRLKLKTLTSKSLVEVLKRYFDTDFITPKKYNFENGITRFFKTQIISVEELQSLQNKELVNFQKEDGVLYYVVPFSFEELEYTKKIIKDCTKKLVVFVLPKTFIECKKDIEELNAVDCLYNNKEILSAGPLVKKELDRHKDILLSSIDSLLKPLTGCMSLNAEAVYNLQNQKLSHFSGLQRFLGDIFFKEYNKYIGFNLEYVNRNKSSGMVTLGVKKVINNLQALKEAGGKADSNNPLNIKGMGPDYAISKTLYQISKFKYNSTSNKYELSKQLEFYSFFNSYIQILSKNKNGIYIEELLQILTAPPYGLRLCILPLFMALADLCSDQPINYYFDEAFVLLTDGNHYDLLMKYPKKTKIHYSPIDKNKQKFLNLLQPILHSRDTSVNGTVESLLRWRKSIPAYTKSCEQIKSGEKLLLIDIDSSREPDKLLFAKIPKSMGFEPITIKSTVKEIENMTKAFKKTKVVMECIYKDNLLSIKEELLNFFDFVSVQCLGQKKLLNIKNLNIPKIFQKLFLEINKYPFSKRTVSFLNRIECFDSEKHIQYFLETVADVLTGSNPRFWGEKGQAKFKIALQDIKTEVELACEIVNPKYQGKSVFVFLDRGAGRKDFVKVGSGTTVGDHLGPLVKKCEDLLFHLTEPERKKILLQLLLSKKLKNNDLASSKKYKSNIGELSV